MNLKKGGEGVENELCDKLYRSYFMRVYSFLLTQTGNADTAQELAQETFYRAFTSSYGFKGKSDPVTWLCAIAKNLLRDEKRKVARHGEMPEETASTASVEETASDRDASFKIHMILHTLKEPYREVFELRVFGELSFAQIGAIFGKTESWARVTFHRAKLQIQERMV